MAQGTYQEAGAALTRQRVARTRKAVPKKVRVDLVPKKVRLQDVAEGGFINDRTGKKTKRIRRTLKRGNIRDVDIDKLNPML